MSNKLLRLGGFAFTKRWWVVAGWLLIVATAVTLMNIFSQPASDAFSIPGTESQVAFDELGKVMPEATGGTGRIVFAVPDGEQISARKDVIDTALTRIDGIDGVKATISPFVMGTISQSGNIALAQVEIEGAMTEVSATLADDITAALEPVRAAGVQAEAGGDIVNPAPDSILGVGEIVGVVVAAITLLVTFSSLAAAGMPLITAFIGVGIGVSGIYALSGVVDVNTVTPILAIMLGLAVGIDYALFIVTRHRKYLMDGLEPKQAAARAIATAGNAVIFAATTVVIALAALSVVGIPFLTVMGLAAAGTVAIAATVAVTLIPALLGFAGLNVLSKKQRALRAEHKKKGEKAELKKSWGFRYSSFLTRRPLSVLAVAVIVLGVIALPATQLQLGFPSDANAPKTSTERKAYDLLAEGFGPGFNGPLLIVSQLPSGLSAEEAGARVMEIAGKLGAVQGVATVQPAGISDNNEAAIFQVIPTTGPTDEATKDLVAAIRDNRAELAGQGGTLYVTGTTAITIDMDNLLAEALPKYLGVVVGLSFILLIIVFRSLIVPLKATLGFLLTIAATFGALVVLFQWGWLGIFEPTPIVSFLPVIVIGIVFGLAMDYEFFLVSGIHEAYMHEDKGKPKEAIIRGFVQGSSVVSAAAIIMISVFSGFIFSHLQMVQMIGFALAFGILVDAFVVRMTIVPAVLALAGKAAWWIPKWLAKIIPNVSIDGDETTIAEALKTPKRAKAK